MRYSGMNPWQHLDEAVNFLARNQSQSDEGLVMRKGLLLDNKLIGTCGLLNIDRLHLRCEIGYGLAPSHWGKGLATGAVAAMLAHALKSTVYAQDRSHRGSFQSGIH